MKNRIAFLDGFRGVAILLVLMFHAYSRYPGIVPFLTEKYGWFPLFRHGDWGVQLFFLLSGFVILMTLEKTELFFHFIYKRWLRLFPAMLIVTIIIFLTANLLYERPSGKPTLLSIMPGLTFIDPSLIGYLLGSKIQALGIRQFRPTFRREAAGDTLW
ncbi:MAG: acyltransferase family protein [Bacteroidales bacterium]|nr:acyltransferase family protein [Bacteroidales bacterium]